MRTALGIGLWVAAVLILGIGLGNWFGNYYPNTIIPMKNAENWDRLAAESSDMRQVMYDLNASIAILSHEHGNPNWFFGTIDTNWGNIQSQEESCVIQAQTIYTEFTHGFFNTSGGSFTYATQVSQLWGNINAAGDRVSNAIDAASWQPVAIVELVSLPTMFVVGLICIATDTPQARYKRSWNQRAAN